MERDTEQGGGDIREPDESPLSKETRRELCKHGITLPGWTPSRGGGHPTDPSDRTSGQAHQLRRAGRTGRPIPIERLLTDDDFELIIEERDEYCAHPQDDPRHG
jgi:hypothetical protein